MIRQRQNTFLLECTTLRDLSLTLQLEIKLLLALHYGKGSVKCFQEREGLEVLSTLTRLQMNAIPVVDEVGE